MQLDALEVISELALPGQDTCERELRDGSLVALLTPEEPPVNTLCFATRVGTGDVPLIAAVRNRLMADARDW